MSQALLEWTRWKSKYAWYNDGFPIDSNFKNQCGDRRWSLDFSLSTQFSESAWKVMKVKQYNKSVESDACESANLFHLGRSKIFRLVMHFQDIRIYQELTIDTHILTALKTRKWMKGYRCRSSSRFSSLFVLTFIYLWKSDTFRERERRSYDSWSWERVKSNSSVTQRRLMMVPCLN